MSQQTSLRQTIFAVALLITWALAMLWAFWWYEARYIRPFGEQPALFYAAGLHLPAELSGEGGIRVVHFHNPHCACEAAALAHLGELIQRFSTQGVSFYSIAPTQPTHPLLKPLPWYESMPGAEHIPASPSVAIWAPSGALAYLGPYSESAVCSSETSLIEPVLEALIRGQTPTIGNSLASGCLCTWPEQ